MKIIKKGTFTSTGGIDDGWEIECGDKFYGVIFGKENDESCHTCVLLLEPLEDGGKVKVNGVEIVEWTEERNDIYKRLSSCDTCKNQVEGKYCKLEGPTMFTLWSKNPDRSEYAKCQEMRSPVISRGMTKWCTPEGRLWEPRQ